MVEERAVRSAAEALKGEKPLIPGGSGGASQSWKIDAHPAGPSTQRDEELEEVCLESGLLKRCDLSLKRNLSFPYLAFEHGCSVLLCSPSLNI